MRLFVSSTKLPRGPVSLCVSIVRSSDRWIAFSLLCPCSVTKSYPALWDPWTITHRAPLTKEFSRQEYWGGLPFPPPGIFAAHGLNMWLLQVVLYHWATFLNKGSLIRYTVICSSICQMKHIWSASSLICFE